MTGEWVRWTTTRYVYNRRKVTTTTALWHRERPQWPGLTACGKPFASAISVERAESPPADRRLVCLVCEAKARR